MLVMRSYTRFARNARVEASASGEPGQHKLAKDAEGLSVRSV